MKIQDLSESKKRFILLQFTKELIKHTEKWEIYRLENILEKESEKRDEEITEDKKFTNIVEKIRKPEEEFIKSLKFGHPILPKRSERKISFSELGRGRDSGVLRIPEIKLPPKFQYLRPTPTKLEIDLGKLNPLVKDPLVKNIECDGASQNIIVEGTMGRKKTRITLDRKEIDETIDKFSEQAKIPTYEGVYKVVVGKMIFSAIISKVIGSKFIIRKMDSRSRFK